MERIKKDIAYLQVEINSVQREMFGGLYLVVTLMVLIYAAAVLTGNVGLYKLVLVLSVTGSGVFALNHYKTDSNAFYIRAAQAELKRLGVQDENSEERRTDFPDYETWKSRLKFRNPVIIIADVLAVGIAIDVIVGSAVEAWGSDPGMVISTLSMFLVGVVFGTSSKLLADK